MCPVFLGNTYISFVAPRADLLSFLIGSPATMDGRASISLFCDPKVWVNICEGFSATLHNIEKMPRLPEYTRRPSHRSWSGSVHLFAIFLRPATDSHVLVRRRCRGVCVWAPCRSSPAALFSAHASFLYIYYFTFRKIFCSVNFERKKRKERNVKNLH